MNESPSNRALRLLRWFCREDRIEEIEGDLLELYEQRSKESVKKAQSKFVWDVIKSFRWINVKSPKLMTNQGFMLHNYLKIGYRNLVKDLKYSLLNLIGLSLGLAVFFIMIMIVQHEYNFDRFHQKGDRLFEVIQQFQNADGDDPEIYTSLNLSNALREELSIVENAVTVHSAASTWIKVNDNRFFEEEGIVAGPQFFEMFDFNLKEGVRSDVLKGSHSIVLEEKLALKLFGDTNPVGKSIELERYGIFTITGILESIPTNSYLQFNFIITQNYDVFFTQVAPWFPDWFQSWEGDPATTFVMLRDAAAQDLFTAQVATILQKHKNPDQPINPHYLINVHDLHFGTNGIDGRVNEYVKGDINQIRLFVLVAFLILFMACFNYINLSIARSINRTKEVGVRKSMGALKGQIKYQFLIESALYVGISSVLAIGWIYVLMPYFLSISGINFNFTISGILTILPFILMVLVLVTILAGFYPSLMLSRFSPIQILKQNTLSKQGNSFIRNSLMVFQYGMVIIILTFLLIVHQQYHFLNQNELGFDAEQLLIVEVNGGGVRDNFLNIKNELITNPKIKSVSGITRMISGYRSSAGVTAFNTQAPDEQYAMRFYGVDQDGLSTLGFDLKYGENFTGLKSQDSTSVFLNETAAALMGGKKIIGEVIDLNDADGELLFTARVTGIISDFHYQSLHDPIGPVVVGYYLNPIQGLDDIVIKVEEGNFLETISFIEQVHNKFDENDVMTWEFMDDMIHRSYQKESTFRDVFLGASGISITIALLGVLGLISYNVLAKTKEFGIRKVLGATYLNLLMLHAQNFIKYLSLAMIIVGPISWWLAHQWLLDYAYRIELTSIPFLIAFLITSIGTIACIWVIVHYSVQKNPVEAIRYE